MATTASTIQISGLARQKLAALRDQAKTRGVTTESYVRTLIEDALAWEEQARTQTFDELLRPLRSEFAASGMGDPQLDKLVDQARTRHHKRTARKTT